jgi:hypothetical protein
MRSAACQKPFHAIESVNADCTCGMHGLTSAGFDKDRSFMAIEISGDNLYLQAISRTGLSVDSGASGGQSTSHSARESV